MSSDISRQRFEPKKDFAAVLMQQGRVLLDADWNEWVEILDRHLRAETIDIIGRCVVPKETPHGFEIGIVGTNLTIGPGRIYVDGLLAENHGAPPDKFDATLAELRGTMPVSYDKQPYPPDPSLVDLPPSEGGPHLVYLDVWRRDVTWLEDPGLVESAVGVDSTTRWQTVWQVRVLPLPNDPGVTCESEILAWSDLIRPSAGRLTTGTFNAAGDPDPCLVPPTGGYKGLENRLYRVEIHSVNAAGEATFKWARHNASVATAVRQIKGKDLVVDLIGHDADLRFNTGDWVEITDDAREFAGLPGIMRKIKNPTDATRTITIEGTLPEFPDGSTLPERHTRIRRWDHKGQVRDTNGNVPFDLNGATSEGVIPVPGAGTAPLLLEDGIQVSFSRDGGRFRVGDYWVFAARTADASIEKLNQAPARGVHHHYCRLALVTFPETVVDCRKFWPPEFGGAEGCEVTVGEGGRFAQLEEALKALQNQPQICICLLPGEHPASNVPILGLGHLKISGCGWGAQIIVGELAAFARFETVTLRDLKVVGSGRLMFKNCIRVEMRNCSVTGSTDMSSALIEVSGASHVTMAENLIDADINGLAVVIDDDEATILLENNSIVGTVSLYGLPASSPSRIDKELANSLKTRISGSPAPFEKGLGSVQLHGNRLTRLTFSQVKFERLRDLGRGDVDDVPVFRSAMLGHNVFDGGDNLLLARHLAMTSNEFKDNDARIDVGAAIGDTAMFTGNSAFPNEKLVNVTRESSAAANLLNIVSPPLP